MSAGSAAITCHSCSGRKISALARSTIAIRLSTPLERTRKGARSGTEVQQRIPTIGAAGRVSGGAAGLPGRSASIAGGTQPRPGTLASSARV